MLSGFFFYLFQPCKVGYNRDLDALILTAHSSYLVIISKKYCPDPFLFLFLFFSFGDNIINFQPYVLIRQDLLTQEQLFCYLFYKNE